MTQTAAGIAAGIACLLTVANANQQKPPQFRTGIEVVQIDVTVLDRERRPIRGLTAADFTVLENGQPQKIVAFSETFIPEPEPSPTAWIRDVAPDVRTNILPEGRLILLVLDDAMLPFDPAIVRNAKAIGRGVVERLGPGDLAAVVFTRDNRNAQDFTNDRTRLLAAVDTVSAGFVFAEGSDEYFHRSSLNTLTKAAEYLAAVPNRRKALVYVSIGVPFDTEKLTEAVQFGTFGDVQGSVAVMLREMQTAFRHAHRSNVTVYGVDPAGLNGLADYLARRYRLDHAAAELRARPFREYLQTVSENTGGRAIINTNDPASEIPRIFRETGAYYIVGYAPTNASADGKFRRLEVRVSREGATVFSRKGYFAPRTDTADRKMPTPPSSLVTALTGLLPKPDLPMAVSVSPFAVRGTRKVAVAIIAGLRQPGSNIRAVHDVELLTSAFEPEGKSRGSSLQRARVVLRPVEKGDAQFEVLSRLELDPGRYSLRIAAHNKTLDLSGSVYADLLVPDFAKERVSLSGLVLGTTPSLVSAPKGALASLIPFEPTNRRTFGASDRVTLLLRVYQGGSAPFGRIPIEARVVNDRNARVFGSSATLEASEFAGDRSADYRLDLPVDQFESGRYLLAIDVPLKDGGTASRHVRFSVQRDDQERPK